MANRVMVALLVVVVLALAVSASIPNKSNLRISEVTEEKLAPHSISNSKLQRHSVGTTNLQDEAVTGSKLGRFAVNERHIAPNTITSRSLAVEEIVILLRATDAFIDPDVVLSGEGFSPTPSTTGAIPSRTLLKPADHRNDGQVENHYVGPAGFYSAIGRASGPGIILGWYPSLNGHLLRYQADRALRDISCTAVHTRDNYVRKIDYNMADYVTVPKSFNAADGTVASGRLNAKTLNEFLTNSAGEVSGALEFTGVYTSAPCLENPTVAPTAASLGTLGDLAVQQVFTAAGYKSMGHTHRSDIYNPALVKDGNVQYCFDDNERQSLSGVACSCGINTPATTDSGAIFTHSRIWNPNNKPFQGPSGTATDLTEYYARPSLKNNPVLDTWMLVHRYEDLGFHDKCQVLLNTVNGEDNAKCRQTQIWVDREYKSNFNQWATIQPAYPYSAAAALVDPIVLLERGPSNLRSRDMYTTQAGQSAFNSVNDITGSLDDIYPYLTCAPVTGAGSILPAGVTAIHDRGIPFRVPALQGADPLIWQDMPQWTGRTAVTDAPFRDRHDYCFIDGFRDRFPSESNVAPQLGESATAMRNNMPPERCSTYTNVGDLRLEAFDPDQFAIPGPAEGTPVYSPSLERIEIDRIGKVTIAYAGRGLPGTTQPDIAITVVVLLNSGVQFQNIVSAEGNVNNLPFNVPNAFP